MWAFPLVEQPGKHVLAYSLVDIQCFKLIIYSNALTLMQFALAPSLNECRTLAGASLPQEAVFWARQSESLESPPRTSSGKPSRKI